MFRIENVHIEELNGNTKSCTRDFFSWRLFPIAWIYSTCILITGLIMNKRTLNMLGCFWLASCVTAHILFGKSTLQHSHINYIIIHIKILYEHMRWKRVHTEFVSKLAIWWSCLMSIIKVLQELCCNYKENYCFAYFDKFPLLKLQKLCKLRLICGISIFR